MARALFGHLSTAADLHLVEEVGRLRGRVRELEEELAELRAQVAATGMMDDLHTELHTLTEPALA